MNQTEKRVIQNIIAKLSHENDQITPRCKEHLEECRIYLDTWIIPPLQRLIKDGRTRDDLELAERCSE